MNDLKNDIGISNLSVKPLTCKFLTNRSGQRYVKT